MQNIFILSKEVHWSGLVYTVTEVGFIHCEITSIVEDDLDKKLSTVLNRISFNVVRMQEMQEMPGNYNHDNTG